MAGRREMQVMDWLNAAFVFVIGLLLGLAISGLIKLVHVGAWGYILILLGLFAALALILMLEDFVSGLFDRVFGGVRPDKQHKPLRSKPVALLLSLPIGIMLGLILEQLGLSGTLLSFL